ncbi:hypothetical protein JOC85_001636 [Bacillus mesophilus]|uniref:Competence protein ComG n=1 Tax=Bacillus mesophilus TaxID=1808955 RepID=A0A6M0Q7W9_9BACI|nr:competence type IV pilus minor pilin ComGG [Bacillus mesophilus]MBM7660864.1 hypothetical protein [Bacillus mesophilus]NEY71590.1 hypothetical protein [Bacillus mesophilus]
MNNQKGYILPFVMMVSTLLFFLLSHQVSLYVTELRFYKEKFETYHLERMMQQSIGVVKQKTSIEDFSPGELVLDEGRSTIQFSNLSSTIKRVSITVQTKNKRRASVILHYDLVEKKLVQWIEVR